MLGKNKRNCGSRGVGFLLVMLLAMAVCNGCIDSADREEILEAVTDQGLLPEDASRNETDWYDLVDNDECYGIIQALPQRYTYLFDSEEGQIGLIMGYSHWESDGYYDILIYRNLTTTRKETTVYETEEDGSRTQYETEADCIVPSDYDDAEHYYVIQKGIKIGFLDFTHYEVLDEEP